MEQIKAIEKEELIPPLNEGGDTRCSRTPTSNAQHALNGSNGPGKVMHVPLSSRKGTI